jgi:protein SCO1/2
MAENRKSYWGLYVMGGMMILISAFILWAFNSDKFDFIRSKEDVETFREEQAMEQRLEVIREAPNFSFANYNGAIINKDSLLGSIYVVDFFFTNCPSICPVMTSQLTKVQEAYKMDNRVKIVSFSVDPENDTPEQLAAYAEKYDLKDFKWFMLRGEQDSIFKTAEEGFMTTATLVNGAIDHSARVSLVDPEGKVRGMYMSTEDTEIEQLIEDIEKLRKEFYE